jgi:YNFM family putative membrane transporter
MLHINTNNKNIKTGSPAFRRVTLALTAAGFSTFAVLYCVQPLLPVFTATFHVSPAESSLALSLSTGLLGIGLLIAGPLSDVGDASQSWWARCSHQPS